MPNQIKLLIGCAVLIIALGGVLFFAQPKPDDHSTMNEQVSGSSLDLNIEPSAYDFGTISMKNGKVTKTFSVKNLKNDSVFLSQLYTSCMCTEAKIKINGNEQGPFGMLGGHGGGMKMLNEILSAGANAELAVTFDPNAHGPSGIGVIERTVTLESDKGDLANINIKATVIP